MTLDQSSQRIDAHNSETFFKCGSCHVHKNVFEAFSGVHFSLLYTIPCFKSVHSAHLILHDKHYK